MSDFKTDDLMPLVIAKDILVNIYYDIRVVETRDSQISTGPPTHIPPSLDRTFSVTFEGRVFVYDPVQEKTGTHVSYWILNSYVDTETNNYCKGGRGGVTWLFN
jgi:hypothetical protein